MKIFNLYHILLCLSLSLGTKNNLSVEAKSSYYSRYIKPQKNLVLVWGLSIVLLLLSNNQLRISTYDGSKDNAPDLDEE